MEVHVVLVFDVDVSKSGCDIRPDQHNILEDAMEGVVGDVVRRHFADDESAALLTIYAEVVSGGES